MIEKIAKLPYDTTREATLHIADLLRSEGLLPRDALLVSYSYPGPWLPPDGDRARGLPRCVGYFIVHGDTHKQELGTLPILAQVKAVGGQEHTMTINFLGHKSDHEFIIELDESQIPNEKIDGLLAKL